MYTVYNEEEERYQLVEKPDHSLTYTYADYLQWKYKERLELFRGKIMKIAAPNTIHQVVSMNRSFKLHNHLKGKPCQVFVAPFDVRLPVKNRKKDNEIITVMQPDVCVVCDPTKIDSRGACGAPDMIVEILSPGNAKKELRYKFDLYEEAGIREYWIINPTEEFVLVYLFEQDGKFGNPKFYTGGDILAAWTVPAFSIDVDDLFERPDDPNFLRQRYEGPVDINDLK